MADETDNDSTTGIDSARLMAFVERRERLEEEKKDIADQIKELKAEIKAEGYEVAQVEHVVKERAKDPDERDNQRAVQEMYEAAAGLN